jgi:hypothetical protein
LATPDRAPAPRRTGNRPLDKDRVKAKDKAKVKDKDKAAAIDVVVVAVVEAKVAKAANRATRTVPLTHP